MSTKERDEMAKEYIDVCCYRALPDNFNAGWDACLVNLLTKRLPEILSDAALNWLEYGDEMDRDLRSEVLEYINQSHIVRGKLSILENQHAHSALREAALQDSIRVRLEFNKQLRRDLVVLREENERLKKENNDMFISLANDGRFQDDLDKLERQEALLRECLPHINGYSPEGAELYAKLKAHLGER